MPKKKKKGSKSFFKEKLNSFSVHLTRFLTVATGERPRRRFQQKDEVMKINQRTRVEDKRERLQEKLEIYD